MRSPGCRKVALYCGPFGMLPIPIAHHLVDAAAVQTAGQTALMLGEVTKECRVGWAEGLQRAVNRRDIPVEGLRHRENQFTQALTSAAVWHPTIVSPRCMNHGTIAVSFGKIYVF